MKRFRRGLVLMVGAFLALSLSACLFGSDDGGNGGAATSYIPLETGNYWRLAAGQVLALRWDVYDDSTAGDVTWYHMRIFLSQGELFMQSITGDAAYVDGEVVFSADGIGDGVFLKDPVEAGQSWSDEWGTTEILSVGNTVSVPAGTFNDVVKIRKQTPEGDQTYYFAKDVGPVKAEFSVESLTFAVDLMEYGLQ